LITSLGVGLARRVAGGRPLVVDVDDWEAGFTRQIWRTRSGPGKLRYLASSSLRPHMAHSLWNGPVCERLVGLADAVTVSNRFLQARFGGTIVRHGRDTDGLSPERYDGRSLRRRLDLDPDAGLVLYFGTIQPYKGVEDLARAVARIDERRVMLVVAGASDDEHGRRVRSIASGLLGDRLVWRGIQPIRAVPEYLAAADVAVIPQRRGPATRGQIPAKLFDAMAMATPIVSTAVGDIPEILDGCGWVVPPGSPESLSEAIADVFRRPDEAAARARLARKRCEREYSWNAMESTLGELFERLDPARRDGPS
jgi:glycosyltransferase involved in cell wall biosynthesis